MVGEKAILGLANTAQALNVLRLYKKQKKKKLRHMIESGTGTIIGTSFTKETANIVAGMS